MYVCRRRAPGFPSFPIACSLALSAAALLALGCSSAAREADTRPKMMTVSAAAVPALPVAHRVTTAPTATTTGPASTEPSGLGLAGYKVKAAYDKAVTAFEQAATTQPVHVGGTVFIGSSSFTKWKTLERDMAVFKAVNRGFGGSRTDDVLYYARRILSPLRPTRIVYYCGSNDLAAKRAPDVVFENFKSFVALARQVSPGVSVYFVAENAAPKRAVFAQNFETANELVAAWAAKTPGVYFIDARGGLFDDEGNPIPSLFLKDGVHLNDEGYKIWSANITRALRGETASR